MAAAECGVLVAASTGASPGQARDDGPRRGRLDGCGAGERRRYGGDGVAAGPRM